jgi:hypothetical protein
MSRILRRPMFRGGPVSSYGTGIATGLGYNDGGRVGYEDAGQVKSYKEFSAKEKKKNEIRKQKPYLTEPEIEELYNKELQELDDKLLFGLGVEEFGPGTYMEKIEEERDTLRSPEGKDIFISEQIAESKDKEKELLKEGLIEETDIAFPKTEDEKKEEERIKQEKLKLAGMSETGADSSQFEKYFKEYLPVIQDQLKPDSDSAKRAKFLELAKVGLGILSQPGGQTLGEVVGKATAPSITNLQTLMAQDEQAEQAPKLLALQAAIKRMEGPTATQLGITAKRIEAVAENLITNYGLSADASYKVANNLDDLRLRESSLSGKFNKKKPTDPKDLPKKGKHYYFTEEGDLTVYDADKKQFLTVTEAESIST